MYVLLWIFSGRTSDYQQDKKDEENKLLLYQLRNLGLVQLYKTQAHLTKPNQGNPDEA
jgi:hypothetical protein